MSRSFALTVLVVVGASYLVGTVKTWKWYDVIIQGKNYSPLDVYLILEQHKGSDKVANKYYKLWNPDWYSVCLDRPFTHLYNGKFGTEQTPCIAMQHYIKHCEEIRKQYCRKRLQEIEDLQSTGWYSTKDYLTVLANFGNERAKDILEMVKPNRKCESLDEMRELASYPLREGKETKITIRVAKFQKNELEKFEVKCGKYNAALQVFRKKLEVLKKDLTGDQSLKLEDLKKKASPSYLSGVKLLFKSETKSNCLFLVHTIGTYDESMSTTPLSANEYRYALENFPTLLEITPEDLEWIQKFFLCRAIVKPILQIPSNEVSSSTVRYNRGTRPMSNTVVTYHPGRKRR